MSLYRSHPGLLLAALVACLAINGSPAEAGQIAKSKKQAAASGQQTASGSVPLRVGLVIADNVRAYHTTVMLARIEWGRRLADKATRIFNETFVTVQPFTEVPAGPAAQGLDLIVIVEVPSGQFQSGFLSPNTYTLSATFVVRNANGMQIFQARETATEKSINSATGPDQAGEAAVRRFIQDLIVSPTVRALLSPAPAAPVETKPVIADTASMDSSGLDVPPPPPWGRSAPQPSSTPGSGRP